MQSRPIDLDQSLDIDNDTDNEIDIDSDSDLGPDPDLDRDIDREPPNHMAQNGEPLLLFLSFRISTSVRKTAPGTTADPRSGP